MSRVLILSLLFIAPLYAAETGYRIVHPDGTVEFTDDATRGGEAIELRSAPTYKAPPSDTKPSSPSGTKKKKKESDGYQSISIISPSQDQTIWFDGNPVSVSVQLRPRLAEGDTIVLEMDGQEAARSQDGSFSLSNVYRGTHTLHVRVEDSSGRIQIDSETVTFHMRRRSVQ